MTLLALRGRKSGPRVVRKRRGWAILAAAALLLPMSLWRAGFAFAMPPLPPSQPTHVVAYSGNRAAAVQWEPPATDESNPIVAYTVISSPGGVTATVGSNVTSTIVNGLNNGT